MLLLALILLVVEELSSMLFLHAGGYGATLSWGGLPTDAVALKARAVKDGLEELFVRLEVLCMAEYNVPVLVKPRLSLDSNRTQGDQVNEHGQQGCNNGESDQWFELSSGRTLPDLLVICKVGAIELGR